LFWGFLFFSTLPYGGGAEIDVGFVKRHTFVFFGVYPIVLATAFWFFVAA
jgi:hypothetical protein